MAHVGICPDVVDISDDDENEIGSGSGVEEELQAIESEIQQVVSESASRAKISQYCRKARSEKELSPA